VIEVAVKTNVEAAHTDAVGRVHGHSYVVEVWFGEGADLVTLAAFVRDTATEVDHSMLENSIGSSKMESLAAWFLSKIPLSVRVVVSRPTLGFSACAYRD